MPYSSQLSDRNIQNLKDPDALISQITREIGESETTLGPWKEKIVKYFELYQMIQRKKHYSGLASIFVPETLRAVETIAAKLYQMIFSQPDWFEYAGRDNNGDDGPALALTHLTRYQMEENQFKSRVMDALRYMVIAGLVVRKVGWDYQEVVRRRPGYDAESGMPLGPQKEVETIKDTWTLEAVDLLSFHISDINISCADLQKAIWIAEQTTVRRHFVNEKIRRGWYSSMMKEKLEDVSESQTSKASTLQDSKLQSSGYSNISKKDKVEIIERWGLCPAEWVLSPEEMQAEGYEPDEQIESVIVIGNRRAILKLERNPYWHGQKPYVACPYIPKESELGGIGAVQISESLQEEINDTRNQTLDNKTLVLSTMWLKSRASGIKNQDLIVRPNGVIQTNDINGLVPLRPPVVAGVGTNMESIAKDDLRQSAGAASNLQGIAQAGVGTATESSIVNRESMGRILMHGQQFAEMLLKPMLVMSEYLNYQFYDHVKAIKIIGPIGVKFRKPMEPKEIAGGLKDVSIKVALDAAENPAVMRQQMMNFSQMVLGMPPQLIQFHWNTLDKIYGMFFSGHTLSELYPQLEAVDPAKLLTPEEERDMALAEQPVLAKKGQDHQSYIQYHEQEMRSMAFALSPLQFEIYKQLIMSHYQLMQVEMEEMAMMQMAQENQGQGGNITSSRGKTKNSSPNTATGAPSTESLRKEIGG